MSDLERLKDLARATLWLAFVYNDQTADSPKDYAKRKAAKNGITSYDEANDFLNSVEEMVGK